MFAGQKSQPVKVSANRGASGIDGTIASALGYGKGLKKPVTLLIGDLAFLHDINSLMLVKSTQQPIMIILINNRGGGIFSFLPIAAFPDVFEKYFATPHPYSFEQAAKFFHLAHFKPQTKSEFLEIYIELAKKEKSAIIEIETYRSENFELHNRIQNKVLQALKEA
jgi:2-succinyl-5-enolpyruvyl-6-hydroxy-3-cyclohexene-1-carboxylate synthase